MKNGSVSPVSKTSSNASTPVTPTSPVPKLSLEENGSINSNGIPKSNGSIKPDTNTETKSEKGNDTDANNIINLAQPPPSTPTTSPTTDVTTALSVVDHNINGSGNNIDAINSVTQSPKPSSPPSPILNAAQPPINGVDTVAAANQKNADSANPVTTPSAPPALSDSSNAPAANDVDASKDNPKVATPNPSVNGTNEQKNDDGDNKATTPSSTEKEEPGTFFITCTHIYPTSITYIYSTLYKKQQKNNFPFSFNT